MKSEENELGLPGAAVGAAIIGVLAYWLFDFLIGVICGSSTLGYSYNRTETSLALASSAAVLGLIFMTIVEVFKKPDRVEKAATILSVAWTLMWLAYMSSFGDICWNSSVRTAATYLFVPIALIALAILGRRWMASND